MWQGGMWQGWEGEGDSCRGETASICQGVRERMHLREAEERDVVFERRAIVLGVFVLLGDRHSLCAVVLAVVCPPVSMAVYTYLHA